MTKINHQFLNETFFIPNWEISHLFLGTFNPEGGDKVNYFYGRNKNQTWKLLSEIFNDDFNPKNFNFFIGKLKKHKIACMDMIKSVEVPDDKISFINGKGYSDPKLINNSIKREHNTSEILDIIAQNKDIKVYSTWGKGSNLASWRREIEKIKNIIPLVSPSMAAKVPQGEKKYIYMQKNWSENINSK